MYPYLDNLNLVEKTPNLNFGVLRMRVPKGYQEEGLKKLWNVDARGFLLKNSEIVFANESELKDENDPRCTLTSDIVDRLKNKFKDPVLICGRQDCYEFDQQVDSQPLRASIVGTVDIDGLGDWKLEEPEEEFQTENEIGFRIRPGWMSAPIEIAFLIDRKSMTCEYNLEEKPVEKEIYTKLERNYSINGKSIAIVFRRLAKV